LFLIYLPFYVVFIIFVPSIFTKKKPKSGSLLDRLGFQELGFLSAILLFAVSSFSKAFALFTPFEATYLGSTGRVLAGVISELAFLWALLSILVFAQRNSIRDSVGLRNKFFIEEKVRWAKELDGFPNLNNILDSVNEGQIVKDLFDRGLYSLTILWSCNVMEETVDEIATAIISENPKSEIRFKQNNKRITYPNQLKNLGYKSYQAKKKPNVFTLWETRNQIAHRNRLPTYEETRNAMEIIVSFTREMPMILANWKSQNFDSDLPVFK
jgi:hypothetical protein